ncbi:hypothetical protein VB711_23855 [Cronbergia sp. UHCC 0137]|nr:hypothetical protein [Cronbergia sp. UHCC 0137]MEA5620851.1 hypothetical protein [Cronbergia sp. UHCC 0137]
MMGGNACGIIVTGGVKPELGSTGKRTLLDEVREESEKEVDR